MTLDPSAIQQKLEYLELRDSKRTLFGSRKHNYQTAHCASPKEIQQFESKHGFELPVELNHFFQNVGNGGAGPYYGIFSLEQISEQINRLAEDPAKPFPFTAYSNGRSGLMDEIEDATDAIERQKLVDEYYELMNPGGSIVICDFGNDLNFRIITSGNVAFPAGSIWFNKVADRGGLAPIALNHDSATTPDMSWCITYRRDVSEPVSFSEWYQCWLDHAVRYAETIDRE